MHTWNPGTTPPCAMVLDELGELSLLVPIAIEDEHGQLAMGIGEVWSMTVSPS